MMKAEYISTGVVVIALIAALIDFNASKARKAEQKEKYKKLIPIYKDEAHETLKEMIDDCFDERSGDLPINSIEVIFKYKIEGNYVVRSAGAVWEKPETMKG